MAGVQSIEQEALKRGKDVLALALGVADILLLAPIFIVIRQFRENSNYRQMKNGDRKWRERHYAKGTVERTKMTVDWKWWD